MGGDWDRFRDGRCGMGEMRVDFGEEIWMWKYLG